MSQEHFNKLTPAEAERLAMLAGEAAKVIVEINKILRHGYESFHPNEPGISNRSRLTREVADFHAVAIMMEDDLTSDAQPPSVIIAKKKRYTHHQ